MTELPPPAPRRAMIGRWNVDQYFDRLHRPSLMGAGLTLFLSLIQQSAPVIVMVEILTIGWTGWIVAKHAGGKTESLTSGAVVGLILGLSFSLGQFLAKPNLLTLISSVWQTLVTGVVGALLATSALLIFSFRHSKT